MFAFRFDFHIVGLKFDISAPVKGGSSELCYVKTNVIQSYNHIARSQIIYFAIASTAYACIQYFGGGVCFNMLIYGYYTF